MNPEQMARALDMIYTAMDDKKSIKTVEIPLIVKDKKDE